MIRLKGKSKGLEIITRAISFPPVPTNHFNEDGNDNFRSRVQIFFCCPSVFFFLVIIVVLIIPLLYDVPIQTTLSVERLNYEFQIPANLTTNSIGLEALYLKFFAFFSVLNQNNPKNSFNSNDFFRNFNMSLMEPDNKGGYRPIRTEFQNIDFNLTYFSNDGREVKITNDKLDLEEGNNLNLAYL
jgi:hypothetical protein